MEANSVLDTIGNTPHVRVSRLFPDAAVWITCERHLSVPDVLPG